ncbi:DUF192 domain-containing protein [Candidatus Woesearchaeota archaeon]|jgi:uncharacterized membrane protein (UPF0127 family)|nr:DUF192 domain-containing protein [Candidatus Woesearchaeota archaeon]MBT5397156.1 DUF192 domain-containing protein [Candidatus Woesearchaeota archaeon]MBT6367298.1 DUF192 domain-containing protein [Candidatus Woesearchaeota archaeon]MBT7762556.1 DUF192 domain-containing protein [Candidatus Woesearchaeota archaeon]
MIKNITTNTIISQKEIMCKNAFSQARGLMFRKKRNCVMEFGNEKKISLHNFFVFYPIDILVIDKDMTIVEIKKNFKPFTFWKSSTKGKYVIELGKNESKGKVWVKEKIKIRI